MTLKTFKNNLIVALDTLLYIVRAWFAGGTFEYNSGWVVISRRSRWGGVETVKFSPAGFVDAFIKGVKI